MYTPSVADAHEEREMPQAGIETLQMDTTRDSPLLLTLELINSGRLSLCTTVPPTWPLPQDLLALLKIVGREGLGHTPEVEPSSWAKELKYRVEQGAALPILRHMAERMAGDAAAAALASWNGAMASAFADKHAQGGRRMAQQIETAHHRVGVWIHSLEIGFRTSDANRNLLTPAMPVLSALRRSRSALNGIAHDHVRCAVHSAIDEGRLPPEAAILGKLAILRDLKPGALDLAPNNGHACPGLTGLATDLSDELESFVAATSLGQAGPLRTLAADGVDAQAVMSTAAAALRRFAQNCRDGRARTALTGLLDGLGVALGTGLAAPAVAHPPVQSSRPQRSTVTHRMCVQLPQHLNEFFDPLHLTQPSTSPGGRQSTSA